MPPARTVPRAPRCRSFALRGADMKALALGNRRSAVALGRGALALTLTMALILFGVGSAPQSVHATTPPSVSIAQYPLTVAVPAHPQVLFVIPNSQSVDG